MVRFTKEGYIIEVHTGCGPVENFLDLQAEIAYVFSILNEDTIPKNGLYNLANLLQALRPEWEVARRMEE